MHNAASLQSLNLASLKFIELLETLILDAETKITTLPETNIAPENRPSQTEISIPTILFQG